MSDSSTPSGIMRSLSAPGLDSDLQRRMLADLSRSVTEQVERLRRMEEDLKRREAEIARREGEGVEKSLKAVDRIGKVERVVQAEQRDLVEQKAHLEVERRLHENAVDRVKEDLQAQGKANEEVRAGLERDRAKISKMAGELEAARERYQADRRELEKRFKDYQDANASLKRAVEDLQVKQHRYVKDREAFEKEKADRLAEMAAGERRLEGREQRFESARTEFSGVAQKEERRLAQEREQERTEREQLEELRRQLEAERAALTLERATVRGEREALERERRRVEEEKVKLAAAKAEQGDSRGAIELPKVAGRPEPPARRSSVQVREERTGKTEAFELTDLGPIKSPLEEDEKPRVAAAKPALPATPARPGGLPPAAGRPSAVAGALQRPTGGVPKPVVPPPAPPAKSSGLAGLVAETMGAKLPPRPGRPSETDIPVVSPESGPPKVKPPVPPSGAGVRPAAPPPVPPPLPVAKAGPASGSKPPAARPVAAPASPVSGSRPPAVKPVPPPVPPPQAAKPAAPAPGGEVAGTPTPAPMSYADVLESLGPDGNLIARLASDPGLPAAPPPAVPPAAPPRAAEPAVTIPAGDAAEVDDPMLKELEASLSDDSEAGEAAAAFAREEAAARPAPAPERTTLPTEAIRREAAPVIQPTDAAMPSVPETPRSPEESGVEDLDEDLLRAIEDDGPEAGPAEPEEIAPVEEPEEVEPMEVQPMPEAPAAQRGGPTGTPRGLRRPGSGLRRPLGGAGAPRFGRPARPAKPPRDLRQLRKPGPRSPVIGMRVTGVEGVPDFDPPPADSDGTPPPQPPSSGRGPRRP